MKRSTKNLHAFTLIELLVVIVIIGILGTVGMLTYSGYSLSARDANRFSTMEKLRDGLLYVGGQKQLPLPTGSKNIKVNGNIIGYQGYAGQAVLDEIIDFKTTGKDPKDQTFYTYYVTKDRTGFQLLGFLEENANIEASIFPQAYAVNYTNRFPHVEGKNLGILTDTSNNPIQDLVATELDIGTTGTSYIAHISDISKINGNNTVLRTAARNYTCRRIQQAGMSGGSGYYKINPGAEVAELNTYCDMTNDGGGWTRLARLVNNGSIQENILGKSIPFTTLKAVKASDPTDNKIATFSTSQLANTNTSPGITSVEGYKIMLGGAGAYGIYNSGQSACSWASTLGMRGAGYTAAGCGSYPTLTSVGKSTGTTAYLTEIFDVDIYVKN